MIKLLAVCLTLISVAVSADPYVQGGVTGYDAQSGSARALAVEAGYVVGPIDISAGIFDVKQRTKFGTFSWSGMNVTTAAHITIVNGIRPLTAFAAYQIADNYDDKFDGRYAVGLSWHLDPFKIALYVSPNQEGWHGNTYDTTYGLSIKYRWELK